MNKGHNLGRKFPSRKRPDQGAQQPHVWSDREIARMHELLSIGLSREQVAEQMSRDFKEIKYSKQSIICKVNRLKAGETEG